MAQQVPGFQFLFRTSRPDAVLIYLPTEGVLGMFGRKREVVVTKATLATTMTELVMGVPIWFRESGIAQKIEVELEDWAAYGAPRPEYRRL